MEPSTEWFEWCRQFSSEIRARQGRDRRLAMIHACGDCQTSGTFTCPDHPENFLTTGE